MLPGTFDGSGEESYLRRRAPSAQAHKNSVRLAATTVAPTGVERVKERPSPTQKQMTEVTAAEVITPRKLLKSCMAVSAGKIIKEEISMAPIMRMPSTMVSAVSTARSVL